MVLSGLNKRIGACLDILDALYFFLQSVKENEKRLEKIRKTFTMAPRAIRSNLLDELQDEIRWLRRESGAIASNSHFLELFSQFRQRGNEGRIFIPKWVVDRDWFSNYARLIVRWRYIKDHAMVVFDPNDPGVTNVVFELEGVLFRDAEVLVQQARGFHKGIEDFRKRTSEDQHMLHTYLRTSATAIFHFLEAYLNGLAFDCLLHEHTKLSEADHDVLVEWDRKKNRRRFVSTETKIFRYPVIFGKYRGMNVDLSACKAAHFLAKDAKELRDAFTHPSPHIDRESQVLRKLNLVVTINLKLVESIFASAKDYVITVEKALFRKPEETVPWIFP